MHFSSQKLARRAATAGLLTVLLSAASCSYTNIEPVTDPNNPSLESVLTNATPAQLNALAVGVEASLRLGHTSNAPYNWVTGTFGREITILATNESRWYTELQGTRTNLDDGAYYNSAYTDFSRVGRAARVFRQSAQSSTAYTDEQKQAVAGFTHTYEALSKLYVLTLQGSNGIRIDLDNYLKPGKFVSEAEGYANIRQLLEQGFTELNAGGSSFPFQLSSGYANFNTPATFKTFNRAIAARVALYQGDYSGALTLLGQSFYNANATTAADLAVGPRLTFNPSTAGDQGNPYYQVPNSSVAQLVTVPDAFVQQADAGDLRLNKVALRTAPRTLSNSGQTFTGRYEPVLFTSQTAPLSIIRNEELILIAAEAQAQTNNLAGALTSINKIRTIAGGVAPLAGTFTKDQLVDEVLKQRRYSLFYEGHRWVDLRRTGRLVPGANLPYSQAPFKLFDKMERPTAEKQWDAANP